MRQDGSLDLGAGGEQLGTKDRSEKDLEAKMNRLGDGLDMEDAISTWVLNSLYISSQNEE